MKEMKSEEKKEKIVEREREWGGNKVEKWGEDKMIVQEDKGEN